MTGWRKNHIKREAKSLIDSLRNNSGQQRSRKLKAWIRIYFNKPWFEVLVYHEIQTKEFEVMLQSLWGEFQVRTFYGIKANGFHLRQNLFIKIVVLFRISCIQVPLKLTVRKLISWLIFSIKRSVFLNSVISQMNFSFKICYVKFIRSCSNIPFFVPISPHKSMQMCDKKIMPNVKFSFLIQHWSVYIKLNNKCLLCSVFMLAFSFDNLVQLIYLIDYCYSISSVSQLSRLYNPHISHLFLLTFLQIFFLLFFYCCLSSFIVSQKSFILQIFKSFLNMKSQWNSCERILPDQFIVLFEIVKESLFVAQIKIVNEMIVHFTLLIFNFCQLKKLASLTICLIYQFFGILFVLILLVFGKNLEKKVIIIYIFFLFYSFCHSFQLFHWLLYLR